MFCSKCGFKLEEGEKFCPKCGTKKREVKEYVGSKEKTLDNEFTQTIPKVNLNKLQEEKCENYNDSGKSYLKYFKNKKVVLAGTTIVLFSVLIFFLTYNFLGNKKPDNKNSKNNLSAISNTNNDNESLLHKANELLVDGKIAEAIDIFKKLENDDKLRVRAKYGLARAYIKMNNYKDAENELISIIKIKPDYYEANLELYDIYIKQNRIEDAYKVIKKYYDLTKDQKVKQFLEKVEKQIKENLVPRVNPSGGELYVGDYITIDVPENCTVYYTMDGKAPNKNSQKYNGKIKLTKEGKITLKILVINNNNVSNELTYEYNVKFQATTFNSAFQKELNTLISNLAEIPYDMYFQEGNISNSQLILFGYWHNDRNHHRGIFSKGDNYFEFEDSYDKLKKEYVENSAKKYFNINVKHETIIKDDNVACEYKNGYYYTMHGDGESPIDYSVVYKMEGIGNNEYYIYAKNYHTSEYYIQENLNHDFYGFNWEQAENMYKENNQWYQVEMVRAKVKKISQNGKQRYIFLEYSLN